MMKRSFYALIFCSTMLMTWSCEQNELVQSPDALVEVDPKLEGTWLLVNGPLDIGLGASADRSRGPAWIHLMNDGKMRGHSSRNILAGNFKSKDNKKINLDVNMLTRVSDTPFSTWFMDGISTASDYRIEGSNMTFLNESSSRQELIFAKLEDQCQPLLQNAGLYNSQSKEKDVVINQIYQIENCLVVDVTYSGGCVEQMPDLVWDGNLGKSLPPLVNLKLYYGKEDPCEALINQTYYFDLSPLFKTANYTEIRMIIAGFKEAITVNKQ